MPETIGDQQSLVVTSASFNSSGFTTQGQISWTDLVARVFQVTVGILSRVSAAGVDSYTIVVGQKLTSYFGMTARCRNQITNALQTLPIYKGIGQVLSFGFGINHIVRVLGDTEEGQLLLVLCASLAECYHADHAAEVLVEMVRTSRAPESLQPSVLQWRNVLSVSSGILSATQFPECVEKFMSLYPGHPSIQYGTHNDWSYSRTGERHSMRQRGCASAKSLADALFIIGRITRGEIKSVTFIGTSNAGWIAAFAEWHFQLTVHIIHARTQSTLYQSPECQQDCQVMIIYEDDVHHQDSSLQVTDLAYRISDVTDTIKDGYWERNSFSVVGRPSWSTALASAFGTDFAKLLSQEQAFGGALGCLSRILKAIRVGDDVIHPTYFYHWHHQELLVSECHGRAFINNLVEWFPELRNLQFIMENDAASDITTALAQYVAYRTVLKTACRCSSCRGGKPDLDNYCIIILLETIAKLSQLLFVVDNPTNLNPSRLGLEIFYYDGSRRRDYGAVAEAQPSLDPIIPAIYASGNWLHDALRLFAGRLPPPSPGASAMCHNGICAYWSAFGRLYKGQISSRVTIATGAIQSHERPYQVMTDDYMASEPNILAVSKLPSSLSFDDVNVVVRETATALKVRFEIPDPKEKDVALHRIMPSGTLTAFVHKTRFMYCSLGAVEHKPDLDDLRIKKQTPNLTVYEVAGVEVTILEATTVQQWFLLNSTTTEFLFANECLNCSLAAAVSIAYLPRRKSGQGDEWNKVWILKSINV